jgi:alkane 1-monooxygenase
MSAAAPTPRLLLPEATRVWALHLLCFVLPVTTLAFGMTAPHPTWLSLAFLIPVAVSVWLDGRAGSETRQRDASLPGWPFDAVLYVLFALHALNLALLLHMVAAHGFWRVDTLVGWQLLGITSGYSGIVVAHEMMHRHSPVMRLLSRILMSFVLYEHFYTEHLRGHHARVGTGADPATARFGEGYQQFFRRTVPAQFRSAWRLEAQRLGDENMRWNDPRLLRSRVVHGLVFEWLLALAVLLVLGPGAAVFYLAQAFVAVRLLECVNFFEHWGLERQGARVRGPDSWDTTSWFTLYTLVGLSRHADHHMWPARPYPQLRHVEASPKLPAGYFGMVVLAFARPRRFQELMTAELERRRLGPFAPARAEGPAAQLS